MIGARSRGSQASFGWLACVASLVFGCNAILGNREAHPYDDAGASSDASAGDADVPATCDGPCAPIVLASQRDLPADMVVSNGYVYWVDQGTFANGGLDGAVLRAPTSGCKQGDAACPQILAKQQDNPAGVAADANGVYWVTTGTTSDGTAWKLAFDGSLAALLDKNQNHPRKVAVDDDTQSVFWVNAGDAPGNGEVRREFFDSTSSIAIVPGQTAPVDVVIKDGLVYWTSYGDDDFTGYVAGAAIDGTGEVRFAKNQRQPRGLTAGATYVYWANSGNGTLMRATRDGVDQKVLLTDRNTPADVAVDENGIYWVEAGSRPNFQDGVVAAARLDGSDVRVLASGRKNPVAIAIDGPWIYWAERGTFGGDFHDGSIAKIAKPF